jgi:hypothetical protein
VNHIELLHTLAEQNTEVLMEHYVGREWEQQYAARHPQPELEPDEGLSLDL